MHQIIVNLILTYLILSTLLPLDIQAIQMQGKVQKHKNELESILDNNGLEIISDFYILSYDAPQNFTIEGMKFYLRLNSINSLKFKIS